jgi:glycosyltransferase involved in cell wall biosynthesis/capsular polysaccharide biosynthesis protein
MTQSELSILHVIVRANATNSQYNEHCLPVMHERNITVCSLFPAEVVAPEPLRLVEGDGTTWGCFRALRRALKQGPYDVVHVHAAASGVLTLMTYFLTFRSRRNLVFTVHNSWRNFRFRNRLFLYWVIALFPTVVTCGRAVRDSLPRSLRTVFGGRFLVVQNGVDLDRVDRIRETSEDEPDTADAPNPGLEVVSVGRLIPIKDPLAVLDAFADAAGPHDRLVFVGDGPLRRQLFDEAWRAGLTGRVRFTGVVERDEVYRIVSRADVFVSASRGEGLPVSVLEAMACKCPVILSDIPPHAEIARLAPGVPLVRPGDISGLSEALTTYGAMKARSKARLGARMRRCVEEHFSVRSMNDAYEALYRERVVRPGRKERAERHERPDKHEGPDKHERASRRGAARPPDSELTLSGRMRRHWPLVVGLSLLGACAGFWYAAVQAPEYEAKSSVVVGEVFTGSPTDDSVKASQALAASYSDLARREPVLRPVAKELGLGDWRLLQKQVHSQPGDKNPLLIQIIATDASSAQAEELADAVANQLVALTTNTARSPGRDFAVREIERLDEEIGRSEGRIDALNERLDTEKDADIAGVLRDDLQDVRANLTVLQDSYQTMLDRYITAGFAGEVQIVEKAYAVPDPVRPDPITLTAAGLVAGLLLAAGLLHLAAGGRRPPVVDQPAPMQIHLGGTRPISSNGWGDDQRRGAATSSREGDRR